MTDKYQERDLERVTCTMVLYPQSDTSALVSPGRRGIVQFYRFNRLENLYQCKTAHAVRDLYLQSLLWFIIATKSISIISIVKHQRVGTMRSAPFRNHAHRKRRFFSISTGIHLSRIRQLHPLRAYAGSSQTNKKT